MSATWARRCRAASASAFFSRALYRNPKILFLDEGTANLDEKNEEMIADLIAQMPITRIVVAHRPALIRRAGKVYEVGSRKIAALAGFSPLHALQPVASAE